MAANENICAVIVCDAGPPIHLDELNCLSLLSDFSRILIPRSVLEEIKHHRPVAVEPLNTISETVKPNAPMPVELTNLIRLFTLHKGEVDALHVAREFNVDIFLTDDASARLAAHQMSLRVHGTIGIIVRAIRRKQKTKAEVIEILRSLPVASTLHIRQSLLDEIIEQVRQSS